MRRIGAELRHRCAAVGARGTLPTRRQAAATPFRPYAGVMRRQVWIAVPMGLIAVAALQSLWSPSGMRPRASGLAKPLSTVESTGSSDRELRRRPCVSLEGRSCGT